MPNFTIHAPGAYGEQQVRQYGYAQVLEADGRVEISGQGGWNPETLDYSRDVSLKEEVRQACDNVAAMLKAVGLDWSNVAHVNSYHVPEDDGYIVEAVEEMTRQFRERIPDHSPIWTCIGVACLGDPKMRVEVRVTAFR